MIWVSILVAALILIAFVRLARRFWDRFDLDGSDLNRRRFYIWVGKGVATPVLVWMLLNFGISKRYPPVLAHIDVAKSNGGKWIPIWLALLLPTVFVVSSYWAAATFVWLAATNTTEMEGDRRDRIGAVVLWGLLLLPVCAIIIYSGGFAASGLAAIVFLAPFMRDQLALGNPRLKKVSPVYSSALKKLQACKYAAAERAVIRQLEKCDSDYTGWMMLAELSAKHFNDLEQADQLIHELCRQSDITRNQMSEALHRLADWYLEPGKDPTSARRVLEEICCAFPATHVGDMARQRISRIWAG